MDPKAQRLQRSSLLSAVCKRSSQEECYVSRQRTDPRLLRWPNLHLSSQSTIQRKADYRGLTANDISYEQFCSSLGSLLLLWAKIEKQVRHEVSSNYEGQLPKSAYGIAGALNAWEQAATEGASAETLSAMLASTLRTQLQEPLNVRNGICHGLTGASSSDGEKPAAFTWEINDEERSITWDELQAIFRWLAKVPFAISMISNSSSEKLGNRMSDNPENREWWLAEFGIELPPLTQK